jgi:hypothetical protein
VLAGLLAVALYVLSANAPVIADPVQCTNVNLSGPFTFTTTNTGVPITREGTATITVVCTGGVDAGGMNLGPTFKWILELKTGFTPTDANANGIGRLVNANTVVYHGRGRGNTLGPLSISSSPNTPSTYTVQNGTISSADLHADIRFDSGVQGTGEARVCNPPQEEGCNPPS